MWFCPAFSTTLTNTRLMKGRLAKWFCIVAERLCSADDERPLPPAADSELPVTALLAALLARAPLAVRGTRPFPTKQTSGCRQKEKPQNPSLLRLCPTAALSPKDTARAPTWTRWQQLISILKHKVLSKALRLGPTRHLGWSQIKSNSAAPSPLPPSFPPFLFCSENCLL